MAGTDAFHIKRDGIKDGIKDEIRDALGDMGIAADDEACRKLSLYMDLLREWNGKTNLSRDIDKPDAVPRIVLDSLTPLAVSGLLPRGAIIVDIGSGAGLPGIPLAIVRGDTRVNLVESTGKKCAFMREAVSRLGLSCGVYNMRSEQYAAERRGEADICVCRAVAGLPTIMEYAAPMLKVGGKLIAYKANDILDAPDAADTQAEAAHARAVAQTLGMRIDGSLDAVIPRVDWRHKLVVITQEIACPDRFPRREGLAARKPIIT